MTESVLSAKLSSGRAKGRQVAAHAVTRLVTFLAGGEVFGIDVGRVREIVEVHRIRAVPQAPLFLEGVIDVRGRILPAVDLTKRLGLARPTSEGGIACLKGVLAEVGEQTVALLVDQVFHVVRVASEDVEAPPPGILRSGSATLVTGIARASEEVIFILRLEALFTADETTAISLAALGGGVRA
ncbi:MAG: chemotaxis protein CheW [Nitrospirae bacterium]|nr:chemotaxis protein CheW [Nitrospirota bacterium]